MYNYELCNTDYNGVYDMDYYAVNYSVVIRIINAIITV